MHHTDESSSFSTMPIIQSSSTPCRLFMKFSDTNECVTKFFCAGKDNFITPVTSLPLLHAIRFSLLCSQDHHMDQIAWCIAVFRIFTWVTQWIMEWWSPFLHSQSSILAIHQCIRRYVPNRSSQFFTSTYSHFFFVRTSTRSWRNLSPTSLKDNCKISRLYITFCHFWLCSAPTMICARSLFFWVINSLCFVINPSREVHTQFKSISSSSFTFLDWGI